MALSKLCQVWRTSEAGDARTSTPASKRALPYAPPAWTVSYPVRRFADASKGGNTCPKYRWCATRGDGASSCLAVTRFERRGASDRWPCEPLQGIHRATLCLDRGDRI